MGSSAGKPCSWTHWFQNTSAASTSGAALLQREKHGVCRVESWLCHVTLQLSQSLRAWKQGYLSLLHFGKESNNVGEGLHMVTHCKSSQYTSSPLLSIQQAMRKWEGPKLVPLASYQALPLLSGKPWTQTAPGKSMAWWGRGRGLQNTDVLLLWWEVEVT